MAIDWDALVLRPAMDIFGEPVLYTPTAGEPITITGVFDEAYTVVEEMDSRPVSSTYPVLGVRLAVFPVPPQAGDRLTIVAKNDLYTVREVRPDGHGAAKLLLNWTPE